MIVWLYILASLFSILVLMSGYFKALMDLSALGRYEFRFGVINAKNDTWENKYEVDPEGNVTANTNNNYYHWYYFGLHKPKYVERFPFSSTALVFLSDDWHLFQFFMYRCNDLAFSLLASYISWWLMSLMVVIPFIRGSQFQVTYTIIKNNNK